MASPPEVIRALVDSGSRMCDPGAGVLVSARRHANTERLPTGLLRSYDISRFIRSGNERDIQVFWARVADDVPSAELKPVREELCSVPFLDARNWLCGPGKSPNLKSGARAWVWDWPNREWRALKRTAIYPGQTVLVESSVGGYRPLQGWDPNSSDPVEPVGMEDKTGDHYVDRECWKRDGDDWRTDRRRIRSLPPDDHADAAEDDESLSITGGWQTIASHGLQVGRTVEQIAAQVAPEHTELLHLSGRWHDLGKAHPAFQGSMQASDRPAREDIAKAPDRAWPCRPHDMYRIDSTDQRHGFRHELASTLGLFGVLQRHDPEHPALLGPALYPQVKLLLDKLRRPVFFRRTAEYAQNYPDCHRVHNASAGGLIPVWLFSGGGLPIRRFFERAGKTQENLPVPPFSTA